MSVRLRRSRRVPVREALQAVFFADRSYLCCRTRFPASCIRRSLRLWRLLRCFSWSDFSLGRFSRYGFSLWRFRWAIGFRAGVSVGVGSGVGVSAGGVASGVGFRSITYRSWTSLLTSLRADQNSVCDESGAGFRTADCNRRCFKFCNTESQSSQRVHLQKRVLHCQPLQQNDLHSMRLAFDTSFHPARLRARCALRSAAELSERSFRR